MKLQAAGSGNCAKLIIAEVSKAGLCLEAKEMGYRKHCYFI